MGGSQAITDALMSAGRKLGVEYAGESDVDRIVVEGTRATGVELADGTRVDAEMVVSGLGLPQTVLRLLREIAGGRSARPAHPQHPLRPRPALLEQPRH